MIEISDANAEGQPVGLPEPQVDFLPVDVELVEKFRTSLGVDRVIAEVLASRGFETQSAAEQFIARSGDDYVADLGDLEAAADRIMTAISNQESIAVHGDYDCDGVCSTALLTRSIRSFGGVVQPWVPERSDGYGLSDDAIQRFSDRGCTVLIAVDCGITAVEEVATAQSLGIETIIVDHHRPRPDGVLPSALIVHPELTSKRGIPMCATAVAGELMACLAGRLGRNAELDAGSAELAAIATVADVMPLIGVNRSIVASGLERLATTPLEGLRALVRSSGLAPNSITSQSVAFGIAPRINAAGRVQTAAAALELLLCDQRERADRLAGQLESANAERRAIQQQVRLAAEIQVSQLGDRASYVLAGKGWHPGVVGIVAGAIARERCRPTIVVAVNGDYGTGSARSVPGFNIAEAIESCSELLEGSGGHAAAAGLTLRSDSIESFREAFDQVVSSRLPEDLRVPHLTPEAFVNPRELGIDLAEALAALEPFGEGNRPPTLCLPNVVCEEPRRMSSGKHVRYTVRAGSAKANVVAFNSKGPRSVKWGERADVFGRLELNEWNGAVEPRFVVEFAGPPRSLTVSHAVEPYEQRGRLRRDLLTVPPVNLDSPIQRDTVDLRRAGSSVAIARLAGSRQPSIGLVSDVDRRSRGLEQTHGGIELVSWSQLRRHPELTSEAINLIALDPPARADLLELAVRTGPGWLHIAWGLAEIDFATKVLQSQLNIDQQLRGLYAQLRAAGEDAFQVLERAAFSGVDKLLVEPVLLAAQILEECGLIELDFDHPRCTVNHVKVKLDDSPIYRQTVHELGEGELFLQALNNQAG